MIASKYRWMAYLLVPLMAFALGWFGGRWEILRQQENDIWQEDTDPFVDQSAEVAVYKQHVPEEHDRGMMIPDTPIRAIDGPGFVTPVR